MVDVYFDITGGCNAKCPYCVTAREGFGRRIEYISVDKFERAMDRLIEIGVSSPGSDFNLYNWGEPILHPQLDRIVALIDDRKLRPGISTNGSKATNFVEASTKNFCFFTVSVPGWSQSSYDKIHGLKFERIKKNIETSLKNMRERGFRGEFVLTFHVYQFNILEEMNAAKNWAEDRGIVFKPYYAYLNDLEPAKAYLKGTMARDALEHTSRSLFMHYVQDLVAKQPDGYVCEQMEDRVVLNHRAEVLQCCALPESSSHQILGSVFDLSYSDIVGLKEKNPECADCMQCGAAYWGYHAEMIDLPKTKKTFWKTALSRFPSIARA